MKVYTIRGFAFDMDGVIIDSNGEIEKFWRAWAAKENIDFAHDTMAKHILGRTGVDTLSELFTHSEEHVKKDIQEAALVFDANMQPPLVQGVNVFLEAIAAYIQPVTLVTSSHKKRAGQMLALHRIEHYFTHYVTGDEVARGKPHPEAFLKAAEKMNLQPEECLAFEDSNSGILSAAEAGMYVIAVDNYKMEHPNIIARIKDFTELLIADNCIYWNYKAVRIELLA